MLFVYACFSVCAQVRVHSVELVRRDYVANRGWETFLSYEDPEQDILIGLLRLRKCSDLTVRRISVILTLPDS